MYVLYHTHFFLVYTPITVILCKHASHHCMNTLPLWCQPTKLAQTQHFLSPHISPTNPWWLYILHHIFANESDHFHANVVNVLGNIFGIVKMIQTWEIAYFMDIHWCLRQCVVILTFRILHVVLCFKNFGGILSELLVECLPHPICYLIKLSCLTQAVSPIVTFRIMNLFKEQDNFVQYCQTVLEYDGGGHREGECIYVSLPDLAWAGHDIRSEVWHRSEFEFAKMTIPMFARFAAGLEMEHWLVTGEEIWSVVPAN
jgi:hypothetical protein